MAVPVLSSTSNPGYVGGLGQSPEASLYSFSQSYSETTLAAFSSSDWLVAAIPASRDFVGKANTRAQIARDSTFADMPKSLEYLVAKRSFGKFEA
ncbi:hypothetical protein F1880_007881 [Penicillium rolfsii]|nr:hypothetical protein F1880_007881 [Penicillium rolfsii]